MIDLEKLINELLELPSTDLEGDGNIGVRFATREHNQPFVVLEDWGDIIYLAPSQALALYDWLGNQRQNLEQLRDALQAQTAQEEATKAQREAERLTALKVKHSEAVTAWQQGGSVGPCPNFEEIANPEVGFVMRFPIFERMLKESRT